MLLKSSEKVNNNLRAHKDIILFPTFGPGKDYVSAAGDESLFSLELAGLSMTV